MKKLLALSIIAAGVTLAVVIGQRMSTDAMAVVIGVVFGVAASIPTSLLVVAATRGRREPTHLSGPDPRPPAIDSRPQIYVVTPPTYAGDGQAAPWLQSSMQPPLPPAGYGQAESSRRFRVVGEDDTWMVDE
jgi:hypothetical protein